MKTLIAGTTSVVLTLGLASCAATDDASDGTTEASTSIAAQQEDNRPYAEARAVNVSRAVSEAFPGEPTVITDAGFSGVSASEMFFDKSDTVVVSGPGIAQELRAASIGVVSHAPVLHAPGNNDEEILAEIERLGANTVLIVGDALKDFKDDTMTIIQDRGTEEALAQLTALQFEEQSIGDISEVVQATAELQPENQTLLVPSWEKVPTTTGEDKLPAFPAQSARDGEVAPIVLATAESGISAVATARAYGASIRFMDHHDPRLNTEHMEMVAGLADKPLLALGEQFGTGEQLAAKIERGETITEELPGGGGLVFPGRRMIALYGHPSGPALGVMGEQPAAEAAERAMQMAAEYQEFEEQPVIPAFEIIATVASDVPGPDGNFVNETNPDELVPYIDAITDAGGYVVLDLQPGRSTFLEMAKYYEDLLKRPNVGLALDPEWRIGDQEQPMSRVGSVEAAEVNEVADWLAQLVSDEELPQKAFILHQFQLQMLRDREQINTDHLELAFILHADGHGSAGEKYATWDALRQDLDPDYFMAWKNFYDEDLPTFTPEQTYEEVNPRPWFVSYQ
ncbi:MBL fold metallo-hydrolase [uncultured Corynebacterium sp.]|uniref:MBL fold metallo-hydrolase n=1 Tax=uncultured Corynebacterium sp. TaxID=159447 RepID=UPI0025DE84F8|nr:MBL fold metallo-hydrolase [uncultured Corynebacterium sp.]